MRHDRWPIQVAGVNGVLEAIDQGYNRVALTSPTGTGKTTMIGDLAESCLDEGGRVLIYTNRKLLLEQATAVFAEQGFTFGIRAAGHGMDEDRRMQISSIHTERARVLDKGTWDHFKADLVIVDECHQMLTDAFQELSARHIEDGAKIVGVTATPIGLKEYYDKLVVAGVTSDGRKCGALVPARHFGCGEPDLKHIGQIKIGEDLSESQNRKAIMVNGIFGRVLNEFNRINPHHLPTILFAPGVKDSIWFAEQFNKAGISAAHIDGENVWINGNLFRSDPEARQAILKGSKDGRIKVLCNRFVLREGIDAPWLCHGIFATVFGSLQSYLQSGGRLLRAHPSLESVTIQDHGGNWWRHGSLNADREWDLEDTASSVVRKRIELLREKKEKEPVNCPQCGLILMSIKCVCGFVVDPRKKSRMVIQKDGTLREHYGDIFPPRVTRQEPDTATLWQKTYWRARNSKKGMSFLQAEGLFLIEHGYYPPRDLPYMPKDSADWFKIIKTIPRGRLR